MAEDDSKKQILKSTGILGFAQVIIILIGIIRVKVLAILLGAVGVGIAGLYQTTIDLIRSVTGLGLGYSAVRDIAASNASNDEKQIASTVLVLRKWVWLAGALGMFCAIVFRKQLSLMAFGNESHSENIAMLSVALLVASISSGQLALLQGLRRIGDMARANVFGAFMGLIGASIIYYFFGLQGIVPALILVYAIALILNWYYTRKIKTVPISLSVHEIYLKGQSMVSLGIFMSLSGLASTGTMYLVRSFLSLEGGLASVGHFVAAWSISSMYISAIFSAMGADFFPRLSSVQNDSQAVTKMVNEQTEMAVLLTAPIIIGMVSFINIIVWLFYSKDFSPTASILDWQLLGDFFKILAWPLGFILLAKGKGKIFVITEISWNVFYLFGVYLGWEYWGIKVTGISFLIAYVCYAGVLLFLTKRLINFSWNYQVKSKSLVYLVLLVLAFLVSNYLESYFKYLVGGALTITAVLYSYFNLKDLINIESILERLGVQRKKV